MSPRPATPAPRSRKPAAPDFGAPPRLRLWLLLALLLVVVAAFDGLRLAFLPADPVYVGGLSLHAWGQGVLLAGVAVLLLVASRRESQLSRQDEELLALHQAALQVYSEIDLDAVLQKVVDHARELLDATYGAVSLIDEEGAIGSFITSGISEEARGRIGPPPRGHGLLGVPLYEGETLRVDDIERDPRAVGFPDHHPPMRSLLAVPIITTSPFRGNLYLTDKAGDANFSDGDEASLRRFAAQAAIAIDHAYLHRRLKASAVVEERSRLAREIHDGMAQTLAYVSTKTQAVREFLDGGRHEEASRNLTELTDAVRDAYAEVRQGILALHTKAPPERSLGDALAEYFERWRLSSGIEGELRVPDELDLSELTEVQLMRIIQEALSNVRRHSRANQVKVEIHPENGRVHAVVADDGVGFDPASRGGPSHFPRFGLTVMQERAESVGGHLEIDSSPGTGTRVRVELPTMGGS